MTLRITEAAQHLVRAFLRNPRHADDAGLRIAVGSQPEGPLKVGISETPEPGDVVVEENGARLFMGPVAVDRLPSHELDVRADAGGRAEFVTRPREE